MSAFAETAPPKSGETSKTIFPVAKRKSVRMPETSESVRYFLAREVPPECPSVG